MPAYPWLFYRKTEPVEEDVVVNVPEKYTQGEGVWVAREEALQRMIAHGMTLKADAIVNVKFMSAEVMPGAAEMMAYGTAVRLRK